MLQHAVRACEELQLSGKQLLEAAAIAREINPANAPLIEAGTPVGNTEQNWRFSQAIMTGKEWPQKQKLDVSFLSGTAEQQKYVKDHASAWFDHINLEFKWVDSGGHVRIEIGNGGGSWCYPGVDTLAIKSGPTMRFGWLDPAVVYHEWGHLIGMIHEHQHPERPWTWDEPRVLEYYMGPPNNWTREAVVRNVLHKYAETQKNQTKFDELSVMLYAIDNRFTVEDYSTGWNKVISTGDIEFVRKTYPKDQAPVEPPKKQPLWKRIGYVNDSGVWVAGTDNPKQRRYLQPRPDGSVVSLPWNTEIYE